MAQTKCWKIPKTKGLITDVSAQISANKDIPSHWKACFEEELRRHTGKGVSVMAHFHEEKGHMVFSAHIAPEF